MPQWLNRHPGAAIAGAFAVLFVATALMVLPYLRGNDAGDKPQAFYLNLESGQLMTADAGQIPPISTPSGEGVVAFVYACGNCTDPAARKIAYVTRYTAEARDALMRNANLSPPELERVDTGRQVARVENGKVREWAPAGSRSGMEIIDSFRTLCPGVIAQVCTP